uniref:Uncharacterized protein n=1 Tax=Euplotes harpa TaxID=151035 RepID=A0A7S3N4Q7_9SPIT|mmetsp:Transcript_10981/g.12349  ORF Transcript_10981/g.12349 Transcript_10981/m.12349 type:complete len:227 (+) Transcript_10981:59-739(+)
MYRTLLKLKSLVKHSDTEEEDKEEEIDTSDHSKSVAKTMTNFYKPLLAEGEEDEDSPPDSSELQADRPDSADKDYYSKFYNLLYEDDNFQEFKERLELDAQLFERDFRRDLDIKGDKSGLSMQITQCLAEIQKWKEDRKKVQREYNEQSLLLIKQKEEEVRKFKEKLKAEEQAMKLEQQRFEKFQNEVIKGGITRIETATQKLKTTEAKVKSEAAREVIEQTLKNK